MRKIKFQNENYYHIYNRGVDKRRIFDDKGGYIRFLNYLHKSLFKRGSASYEEAEPRISLVAYCLLPNHYHLLVKQSKDNGVSDYIHDFSTSYTMFYKTKNNRSGVLFQGRAKVKEIKSDNYLLYLSAYVNGNAEIHKIIKAENWPWSSYLDYIGKRNGTLPRKENILKEFFDLNEYQEFVKYIIKESAQKKEDIKEFLLE